DCRSARITEPEQLCCLVESFSRCVVERRTESGVASDTGTDEKLTMPSRNEQKEVRKVEAVRQTRRQRVTLEMVDRQKRLPGSPGNALGHHSADDQTTDQTGTGGGGHTGQIGETHPSLGK